MRSNEIWVPRLSGDRRPPPGTSPGAAAQRTRRTRQRDAGVLLQTEARKELLRPFEPRIRRNRSKPPTFGGHRRTATSRASGWTRRGLEIDLTVWRHVQRQEHGRTAREGVPYVANPNLSEVRVTRWPGQVEPAPAAWVLLEPGQNTALAPRPPRGPDGQAGQQEALGSRVRD